MLKNIVLALVATMILAFASTALLAQGSIVTDESVKTFLKVYSDPTPQAVAQATLDLGDGAQDFATVAFKINAIYQLKASGVTGDALNAQVANLAPPMNITAEEIAVYDANEDQIKEVLSKLTQAQQ